MYTLQSLSLSLIEYNFTFLLVISHIIILMLCLLHHRNIITVH